MSFLSYNMLNQGSALPFEFQRKVRKPVSATVDKNHLLKKGIWMYFLLLIFDGALRKWFLPGLATPLLVVRDPIALWLLLAAVKRGLFPANAYIIGMFLVGIIGTYTAVFFGHGSFPVAIYGARVFLLHFPLVFLIGRVFNREDVARLGKAMLWISIPMTILIALQFYSPQSAWVNRGVGGNLEGAGFSGALDYLRPPGTFSFTNGTTLFYGMLSSFIFYFWIKPKEVNRWLLCGATVALLAAIPLSISRSLFFHFSISLVFALIAIFWNPKYFGRMLLALLGGVIAIAFLSKYSFFQTATDAFTARFESASRQEGGMEGVLGNRYLGGMYNNIALSLDQPLSGAGLGMGTNVGSMLLSGKQGFMVAENEWGRTIGELGPLMGLLVIFIRLHLSFKIMLASFRLLNADNLLPWMLLSFGLLNLPQGQWGQPTSLGFSILIGGLMMAAMRRPQKR